MLVEINQDKVEKAIQKAAKLSEQAGEYISDVNESEVERLFRKQ
jgi:hypothetical protein